MPRYLIELTHEDEHAACVKALERIQRYGSVLLTRIEWGCRTGVHSGWIIVEVDTLSEAKQMVPPEFREEARVVEVDQFSKEEIDRWSKELEL